MRTPKHCALLLAVCGFLPGLTASATGPGELAAYSTLGANDAYYPYYGAILVGASSPYGYQELGNQFTPTVSGILSSIELGLNNSRAPILEHLNIRLALNAPGGVPADASLVSGTVLVNDPPYGVNESSLSVFVPSAPVLLTAGTLYWVVVTPNADTDGSWQFNSVGATNRSAFRHDPVGPWIVPPPDASSSAYRVNIFVPEPATPLLVVLGLGFLARSRSDRVKVAVAFKPRREAGRNSSRSDD